MCVIRDFGKAVMVQAIIVLGTYVEIVGYTFVYLKTKNMSYQILLLISYVATVNYSIHSNGFRYTKVYPPYGGNQ